MQALFELWVKSPAQEAGKRFGVGASRVDLCLAALTTVTLLALLHRAWSLAVKWRKLQRLSRTVPCVGGGLPFLGQAINLVKESPWDVAQQWAKRYGPIYRFNLFSTPFIVISDPHLLKEIMQRNMPMYHKDLGVSYRSFLPLLGTGIVTSDGAHWRMQRKRTSAALRIEVLTDIPRLAQEATRRLADKLDAIQGTGQSIEIGEELRTLTLQVIAEVLMSLTPEESDKTFKKVYMPIVVEGHKRVWLPMRDWMAFLPAWWLFRRDIADLNGFIRGVINRRWELRQTEGINSARQKDVLDRVMDHIPADEWGPEDVRQITDEMKTFVLAGHETSATMLNWAIYELLQNPDCETRATAEADAVYGTDGGLDKLLPTPDELSKLEYTTGCLKEALRKYSIVPTVTRVCVKDNYIRAPIVPAASNGKVDADPAAPLAEAAPASNGGGGAVAAAAANGSQNGTLKAAGEAKDAAEYVEHFIPQGASLMLFIKGVHDRPDLWPEPDRYDPGRFLQPVAPYTFLPFIDGPRNCLGQHLSLLESRVVLSLLLHRYRFTLTNGEEAAARHPWIVPIMPKNGTFVSVELRKH